MDCGVPERWGLQSAYLRILGAGGKAPPAPEFGTFGTEDSGVAQFRDLFFAIVRKRKRRARRSDWPVVSPEHETEGDEMNESLNYLNSVIRERTAEGAFLLEGEELKYQARVGIAPTLYVVAVVLLFLPPFVIWGPLFLGAAYWVKKTESIWVTNKRVVHSAKWPFSNYSVVSMPLNQISMVRRRFLSGFVSGIFDSLFHIGDIQIHLQAKLLPQLTLTDVKDPRALMRAIKSVSAEIVEGE